ncbi:MAG: ABC transporter permease [Geminicoccaceae bacterium]
MAARAGELPTWADVGLLPLINLAAAFLVSGVIVMILGENPLRAVELLVYGAFGYGEAIGYTLFYATTFIFAGLAFAVAFHGSLFNIGAEGQGHIGGLGLGLVCLYMGDLPFILVLPLAILGATLFGGFWGMIPGYLQAKRGSHVVITTIMFNFIASALMTYMMVRVLIKPGQASPESESFPESARLPQIHDMAAWFGLDLPSSPLNLSFLIALLCCIAVYIFIWRSRIGYELRVVGRSEHAAVYAGISPAKLTILAMTLSGALAGCMALNILMGNQFRLMLDFTGGFGFVGIAVSLMGRNHPVGIVLAAILFGALYQGGSELAFDMPAISRDMVIVIQGLVILFAGALENMFRPSLIALLAPKAEDRVTAGAGTGG